MTPELKTRIERLETLDKARTQGKWSLHKTSINIIIGHRVLGLENEIPVETVCDFELYNYRGDIVEKKKSNAAFITEAPLMMQTIRELAASEQSLQDENAQLRAKLEAAATAIDKALFIIERLGRINPEYDFDDLMFVERTLAQLRAEPTKTEEGVDE